MPGDAREVHEDRGRERDDGRTGRPVLLISNNKYLGLDGRNLEIARTRVPGQLTTITQFNRATDTPPPG